jgi:hypothetical protein
MRMQTIFQPNGFISEQNHAGTGLSMRKRKYENHLQSLVNQKPSPGWGRVFARAEELQ